MYKGQAGINHLNALLQELFNPKGDRLEFNFNTVQYRAGDKILHLVNDAQANVFNGDLGVITDLVAAKFTDSKQDEIIMDFDGQELTYPRAEWYKITLAYAMSIHKSQGSEFSTVIVPMVSSYSRMLERNLLYTAVTRAKQSLILLGESRAFAQDVAKEGSNRKTYLVERLTDETQKTTDTLEVSLHTQKKSSLPKKESSNELTLFSEDEPISTQSYALTEKMIQSGEIDPLIGLTPTDLKIFQVKA